VSSPAILKIGFNEELLTTSNAAYKFCKVFHQETRDWCKFSSWVNTFRSEQNKDLACFISFNLRTISSNLCSMFYKLETLSDHRFQEKLSPSFPSRNSELNPLVRLQFQIASPPPFMASELQSEKPNSPS